MSDQESIDNDLSHAPLFERGSPQGTPWSPASLVGSVLDGRFRLVRPIGQGGMGIVFRAEQQPVGREVAVKVLRQDFADDAQVVARFEAEARIIADLRHPNVVKLIDFGRTPDGLLYMVTELLRGTPLSERVGTRAWQEEEVVWLLRELAEPLAEAHAKGIVHRDLKPNNIFIERVESRELVKLLDFGIAKLLAAPSATRRGLMIGTPTYMSPEQARGAPVDARTDLYSLGVIAFECLARRPPFVGDTLEAVVSQIQTEAPPSLASMEVSAGFDRLLAQLLSKSPDDRPASAAALRDALSHGAPGPVSPTEAPTGYEDTQRSMLSIDEGSSVLRSAPVEPSRTGRVLLVAALVAVVAVVALIAFGAFQ